MITKNHGQSNETCGKLKELPNEHPTNRPLWNISQRNDCGCSV